MLSAGRNKKGKKKIKTKNSTKRKASSTIPSPREKTPSDSCTYTRSVWIGSTRRGITRVMPLFMPLGRRSDWALSIHSNWDRGWRNLNQYLSGMAGLRIPYRDRARSAVKLSRLVTSTNSLGKNLGQTRKESYFKIRRKPRGFVCRIVTQESKMLWKEGNPLTTIS